MTEGHDIQLIDLADSILEGTPIDWDDAEVHASEDSRGILTQLRLIAALANFHRSAAALTASAIIDRESPVPVPGITRWGTLDVLEHLDQGSFGDVYRALDRNLEREVALKILREESVGEDTESILSEGRLLARVRHPNVITIYGADRFEGRAGLWMELLKGQTLEEWLTAHRPLSVPETQSVALDVCSALRAVHEAGILHRDLKAQNVMREESGRIVLMDFGAGKKASDVAVDGLAGTPLYLAPELFDGAPATRQSDIYSLGVLLFYLLTGVYPVQSRSIRDIREQHRRGHRGRIDELRPDVPARFARVVDRALSPSREARYTDAAEMERALRDAAQSGWRSVVPWRTAAAIVASVGISVGLGGGKLPANPGQAFGLATSSGQSTERELVASRLDLPPAMFVGGPSADGRFLAYVNPNRDVALLDLSTRDRRVLTKRTPYEGGAGPWPFLSSDGTRVAYRWETSNGSWQVRQAFTDGTAPAVLWGGREGELPSPLQWSSDSTQLLARIERTAGGNRLVLIDVPTGRVKELREFDSRLNHPALSPDGRFVAFEELQIDNPAAHDIWVMRTDTNATPLPLVTHSANDLFPLWTEDGRLVFSSDRTGALSLWSVRVDNGRSVTDPEMLVRELGRLAWTLGLTATGDLYYQLQHGLQDAYVHTVDVASQPALRSGTPVSSTIGRSVTSQYSPDGRYLAYVATRGYLTNDRYARTLDVQDLTTGDVRRLMPPLGFFIEPRWSPDSSTIVVRGEDLRDRAGLFRIDVATGQTQPALQSPPVVGQGVVYGWSPDGAAIWYDQRGRIVSRTLATGHEEVVADYAQHGLRGLVEWPGFRVSPDGSALAYTGTTIGSDGARATVIRIQALGGESWEVARAIEPERIEFQDWTPDGLAIWAFRRHGGDRDADLVQISVDGTSYRVLGSLPPSARDLSLRRDGRAVSYTAGTNSFEVWVLKNFLP